MNLENLEKQSPTIRIALIVVSVLYWAGGPILKSVTYGGFKVEFEKDSVPTIIMIALIVGLLIILALDGWGRALKREAFILGEEDQDFIKKISHQWPSASKSDMKKVRNMNQQSLVTKSTFFIFYILPALIGISCIIHFSYIILK